MAEVKVAKFKHCPECGTKYHIDTRGLTEIQCLACDHYHFFNRSTVTTLIIPDRQYTGLWLAKRGKGVRVKPGLWCLPAGFSMRGETLRVTGSRETKEEIQIEISDPENSIRVIDAHTSTELTNDLIIGYTNPENAVVKDFVPSFEIEERRFIDNIGQLPPMAFSIHEEQIRAFFRRNNRSFHA